MAINLYNADFMGGGWFAVCGGRSAEGHVDVVSDLFKTIYGPGLLFGCSSNTANPAEACDRCRAAAKRSAWAVYTGVYLCFPCCLFTKKLTTRKGVKYVTTHALEKWCEYGPEVVVKGNAAGGSSMCMQEHAYNVVEIVKGRICPVSLAEFPSPARLTMDMLS